MAFDGPFYSHLHSTTKAAVLKYLEPAFFQNKTVISIGEGGGDYARWLTDLSANVLATDGRADNVSDLSGQVFPSEVFDANTSTLTKTYDLCWHIDTLYHLTKFDDHLANVCNNVNFLILQCDVIDSDDATECTTVSELSDRRDQSLAGVGTRPSPAYVEAILSANGMHFKRLSDPDFNLSGEWVKRYDWTCQNTKKSGHNAEDPNDNIASFWICWKNGQANPIVANLQ